MHTYQFKYPTKFIPDLKKVASECEIDCICNASYEPGLYDVTMSVSDPADLLDIGRIMGANRAYDSIQGPLKEFIGITEGKIQTFLDENPDYKPETDSK